MRCLKNEVSQESRKEPKTSVAQSECGSRRCLLPPEPDAAMVCEGGLGANRCFAYTGGVCSHCSAVAALSCLLAAYSCSTVWVVGRLVQRQPVRIYRFRSPLRDVAHGTPHAASAGQSGTGSGRG
jgi:hypothetical protein